MADEPKTRRRRRRMLVLLAVGVTAWLVRYRIREHHGPDNTRQHIPAAPRPAPAATPASAAADITQPSSTAASPNPVTPQPAHPTTGPAIGPVTAMPPVQAPAPGDTPAPNAATEPEPQLVATPDEPVKPTAATPAPPQPDAAEPAPPTSATTQPAPPTPAPDQPADAPHPTRSGAVPTAGAPASVTTAARADPPFGPGSIRARSDGSSPDPAYMVKGKTATKAFYTPAAAYYTRTRADVWFRTADDARAAGFTERVPRRHR